MYSLFYTPFFYFNPHYQYISLLNLRPFIFGLTSFHTACSITLTPFYSIISYGDSIGLSLFDLHYFCLSLLFSNKNREVFFFVAVAIPTYVPCHEDVLMNGDVPLCIPNVGLILRRGGKFTHRRVSLPRKDPHLSSG
jgi:hypothetical protein